MVFLRTAVATLVPWRFWKRLDVAQAVRVGRLKLWAELWLDLLIFPAAACWLLVAFVFHGPGTRVREFPATLRLVWDRNHLSSSALLVAILIVWPVLIAAGLSIFTRSMRRSGIPFAHVWRVVLYALPLMATPVIVFACGSALGLLPDGSDVASIDRLRLTLCDAAPPLISDVLRSPRISPAAWLLIVWIAIMSTAHLVAAHLWYLRIRHGLIQMILMQAMVWEMLLMAMWLLYGQM